MAASCEVKEPTRRLEVLNVYELSITIIHMKAIQFTIDEALLKKVDADPEAREVGRSAFLRKALEAYLLARREGVIREAYRRGYETYPVADTELPMAAEALAWPEE